MDNMENPVDMSIFYHYNNDMVRPKKKKSISHNKLMQVRLQQKEYRLFKKAADNAGLDLSAWVRERLRTVVMKELRTRI